tara:strand:+ start:52 stop:297 length:246 start_codon:yes stop_codon:yes gene_type:complete
MSKKDTIVFHFNKGHLKDPTIPMWVIKHKGTTHYVDHLDVSEGVGFSTKETPVNPHTKGSLKFKGQLTIEENNNEKMALIT